MSKECTTHHHACDCREEKFKDMERENKQLRQTVLETLNQRGQRELIVAWDRAKELERENAALRELTSTLGAPNHINIPVEKWHELRKDKERLDWIAKNRSVSVTERPLAVTPDSLRAAIDAARKEAQP